MGKATCGVPVRQSETSGRLVKRQKMVEEAKEEFWDKCVPDPGKGVCADPVNRGATLGKGGPDPQGGNKERQLSPDKGRDKT
jgi:hypothetical protein